ncbi:MFS transporter [Streptomyces formicae]|uniref:Integral membrane protein n=1 Tax=Streptomyces formicae TaxID=1616117 RepID=A0A291QI12_9ACTN|nr:MFS transporter [Streptomyces formicae]ATL31083.1 integral membrane protein [Streptomyces formicae]
MEKRYSLGRYLAGAVAARAGDEMSGPALMLAGFALTGSAVEASSLLAGVTVAAAVGGPALGVLLDRSSRPGRLLAGALVLYAAGLGAILAGLGRLPFAGVLLIAVPVGLLGPALSGGWTAQLPRVIVPGEGCSERANALDAMTFGVASLAGPALAGGVAEALGAPAAVVVSVALIALAAPAAWLLPAARPGRSRAARSRVVRARVVGLRVVRARAVGLRVVRARAVRLRAVRARAVRPRAARPRHKRTPHTRPRHTRTAHVASVAGELVAGARVIVGRPALARATVSSVVSCVAQGVFVACVPLLGERALGEPGRGALLLTCVAVSALAANAVLARYPRAVAPDTVIWASALVQAAALSLVLAVTLVGRGHSLVLVVAACVLGIGEGPQLTALFAVRHREAPERLRGQIFTTGASLKVTGFALGAAVAGPVAARSLPGALALATGVAALAALACLLVAAPRPASSARLTESGRGR